MRGRLAGVLAVAVAFAVILALPAPAAPSRGDELYGGRIAALTFEGDAPPQTDAWGRLTDLRPGQTLTQAAVRRALRDLFASRLFLDLAVEASPGPDGVLVLVRFVAAPRIRSLEIVGTGIPQKGRLRDAIAYSVGDLWTPDAAEPLEETIRRHLKAWGRFEAKAALDVTGDPGQNYVDLRIEIEAGAAAVAAPPEFLPGPGPVAESRLLKVAKQKPGKGFQEARARADSERYEAFLRESGYGRAEVRWDGVTYEAKTRKATPRYNVFVGPLVVLKVTGAPVADVKKHPDSPWRRLDLPDEETVLRFRERLLETYQEQGHAKAKVEVSFETERDEEIVSFVIDKGDRYAVGRVAVDGTKAVKARTVRDAVETGPPALFSRGRLVEANLSSDADAILGVYLVRGYRDAKVAAPEVTPGKRPFALDVTFHVTEGPRFTVTSRSFSGNAKLTEAELLPGLSTSPGRPFTEEGLNADVATLGGRYQEKGFPDARVDGAAKLVPGGDPSAAGAEVGFSIFEGERVFFGKTIVRGYRKTRLSVIERQLGSLEGQPFSLTKALEMQRSLASLGVFSRADIQTLPTDPDTGQRTVLVTVTEGKPWSLLYGFGADYSSSADPKFSLRVSLGASYNNLFGRAIVAGGDVLVSRRQNRFRLFLREPSILDSGYPLAVSVFAGQDFQPGYSVKRGGVYFDTSRKVSRTVKALLRLQYEIVQPSEDPGLGPDQLPNQQNLIASIGPALSWDMRDDPIAPTKGFLVTGEMKYAFPLFAATAHFLRGSFLAAGYHSFFPDSVLAVAVRFGAIQPWGPCDIIGENPECKPNLMVPIPERLFAGGRTTHRAFGQDALGIIGQTVNDQLVGYGGAGMLLFNVEWRQRLAGGLGGALFFDDGNTWDDWRKVNLGEIRPGIGVGLFYTTPVGPIRIDYGMKLDKRFFETLGVFNFSVGYAF
jgi:outer membrane protein assembly complex protein YaeT